MAQPANRHSRELSERSPDRPPPHCFQHLFDEYYRPIVRFFTQRGFPLEESRDLAQETFLRAFKGLDRFRGEAGIQTWLFTIAANLLRNTLREKQADKRSGEEVPLETDSGRGPSPLESALEVGRVGPGSPLDGLLARERSRQLRQAVEGLPPRMRRCVMLRLDQDLAYREIALLLQVSVETVKGQLFQARRRLFRSLGEQYRVDF